MSRYSFRLLSEKTADCISDMQNGVLSPEVERLIFTTIAATGVIRVDIHSITGKRNDTDSPVPFHP